ncbi:hypothetical protein ACWIWK_03760 [Helicobacter sp. 23-1048]
MATYLSAASFASSTFKEYCEVKKCYYGNVGLGVGSYSFNALDSDFGSSVGYLYAGGGFIHNQRIKFDTDVRIGGGRNTLQGNNFPASFATSLNAIFVDFTAKLGKNVLSKQTPLFINFTLGLTLNTPHKKNFGYVQALLGIEIDGQVPLASNLILSYGAGYGWLVMGYTYSKPVAFRYYQSNEIAESRSIGNFELNANVGVSYKFENDYVVFIRAVGRFQHINASETITYDNTPLRYPANNNYAGMLEMGVEF